MFLALAAGTETTMAPIITAMGTLVEIMEKVFSVMTSNPVLLVFLAGSMFGVGIRIFKKVKSAARG